MFEAKREKFSILHGRGRAGLHVRVQYAEFLPYLTVICWLCDTCFEAKKGKVLHIARERATRTCSACNMQSFGRFSGLWGVERGLL